jgi:hypothetical protein
VLLRSYLWGDDAMAIRPTLVTLLAALLAGMFSAPGSAATLSVGPNERLKLPSQAANEARDGDTVEIAAGLYRGDAAVWEASNLTIRGVGGRAHLESNGVTAEGKAIWVVKGRNTVIENMEFSGAAVPDANGAGIRHEGVGLRIVNSRFHHNEMGVLTSNNPNNEVVIEHSEFDHSIRADGDVAHNIYIGNIKSFTLRFSYIHETTVGHNVKSRARENFVLYNRIADELDGSSSYAIDIPWGGPTFVIGNVIQKGPRAENNTLIAYAAEGTENENQELYVINNTMISQVTSGTFVRAYAPPSRSLIVNNIMVGSGSVDAPGADHNLRARSIRFADRAGGDYHVTDSRARDAGVNPGEARGRSLAPKFEYVHPLGFRPRRQDAALDLGAFEAAP